MAVINPSHRAIKGYPADDRWMYWDGSVFRPYASIAEVNTTIESTRRHKGLQVNVNNVIYWYKEGITDADLVAFTGGLQIRFKIGDGQPGTPAASATAYVNEAMKGLSESDYTVFRNGTALYPGDDYTNEPTGGGFELAGIGNIFSNGETFLIK